MILEQFYLGCLAHASYLIADENSGEAAIVDPQRDVDGYLDAARRHGLEISHVILTHFHADFVSGHLELQDRTGAAIHLGPKARTEYEIFPVGEEDHLDLGRVRLGFLETPGHTPEGICVLVYDLDRDEANPHAVLTGDTLFIGDVGRPDLLALKGVTPHEMAGALYDSLHEKLMRLPDHTLVYPAHGAGSFCGKNMSSETVSTIGAQRSLNYALRPMDKPAFIEMLTADLPQQPEYFAYDADVNRRARPTLDQSLSRSLVPLSLDDYLARMRTGARALDVRDDPSYARSHLIGSLNIGLGGNYASWAGSLLRHDEPILLIADPGREEEGALRLGRIGFDNVEGYLDAGMEALANHPELVGQSDRLDSTALAAELREKRETVLLDVRTKGERERGHIGGSLHIPMNELSQRMDELDKESRVVVFCAAGYRSSMAASLMRRQGFDDVTDLVGGFFAWRDAGQAVSESDSASA